MLVGAMNHPARDVIEEMRTFAALGLDFLDLTLEPPAACPARVDAGRIARALQDLGLGVVGHTAFYLPLASPFDSLRAAAVEEVRQCLRIFGEVGARWVNLHADGNAPFHSAAYLVEANIASVRELLPAARDAGVGLMLENTPGRFNAADQLAPILDAVPELGLHLDLGHCNLQTPVNTAEGLLRRYGQRLRHVHLHDNRGDWQDLHLPLGAGTLDARRQVRALRATGYDDTITLEVFAPDHHYLCYSRDRLRQWWDEP